jgi:hypothetical protein
MELLSHFQNYYQPGDYDLEEMLYLKFIKNEEFDITQKLCNKFLLDNINNSKMIPYLIARLVGWLSIHSWINCAGRPEFYNIIDNVDIKYLVRPLDNSRRAELLAPTNKARYFAILKITKYSREDILNYTRMPATPVNFGDFWQFDCQIRYNFRGL